MRTHQKTERIRKQREEVVTLTAQYNKAAADAELAKNTPDAGTAKLVLSEAKRQAALATTLLDGLREKAGRALLEDTSAPANIGTEQHVEIIRLTEEIERRKSIIAHGKERLMTKPMLVAASAVLLLAMVGFAFTFSSRTPQAWDNTSTAAPPVVEDVEAGAVVPSAAELEVTANTQDNTNTLLARAERGDVGASVKNSANKYFSPDTIAALLKYSAMVMNSDMKNIVGTAMGLGIITDEQLASGDLSGSDVLSRLASGERMSMAAVASGLKADAAKKGFTYDTSRIYEALSNSVRTSMLVNNRQDAQRLVLMIGGAQSIKNIDSRALKTPIEMDMYNTYMWNKDAHDALTAVLTGATEGLEEAKKAMDVLEMWEDDVKSKRITNSLCGLSNDTLKTFGFSEEQRDALRKGSLAESDLRNVMERAYAMNVRMARLNQYDTVRTYNAVQLVMGSEYLIKEFLIMLDTQKR